MNDPNIHVVRQGGFTLVELMVVIAVIAIVAGIAVPSMRRLILANRITAAGNEVVAGLNLARMEAVRRRVRVTVCPSTDGAACAAADTSWKRFIVRAADGTVLRDTSLSEGDYTVVSSGVSPVYAGSGFNTAGNGRIAACTTGLAADNQMAVDFGVSRISSVRRTSASCAVGAPL